MRHNRSSPKVLVGHHMDTLDLHYTETSLDCMTLLIKDVRHDPKLDF